MLCCLFTYSDVHHILCCVVCLRIVRSTTYCVVLFVYVYSDVHHILCCVVCLRIVRSTTYCVVLFVYV